MRTVVLLLTCVCLCAPLPAQISTKAKVEARDQDGPVPLKREEQIALMFVSAINALEDDCTRQAAEPCTLEALVRGPRSKDGQPHPRLKFNPDSDPNYTYKVRLSARGWEIWANPGKPGLGGFYHQRLGFAPGTFYNPKGAATAQDRKLTETNISGDSFTTR